MNELELINIMHLFSEIHDKLTKRKKELLAKDEYINITLSEYSTIYAIGKNDSRTMSEISEKLNIAPNSTTVAVDRLILKELAVKESSYNDRRVQLVKLTPKAIKIMEEMESEYMNNISYALSHLTETEILIYRNLLEKINSNI